jgi:AraC family transcriptional activator of pobA
MTIVPTYELYGENTREKSDFWLHCETIPSRSSLHRWEILPHRHENFFQILYITSGMGEAAFGTNLQGIGPCTVVTIPPGIDHGYRFSKDVDGYVFTMLASQLSVARGPLATWLMKPRLTVLNEADGDGSYAAETLTRLASEFILHRNGRMDLLDAYLTVALQHIAQVSGDASAGKGDLNERRMARLHALLHKHLREHQPVPFYADQLGVSGPHLNRIVKEATGRSVQDFIALRLAHEAQRELVFSPSSVQEISYRLGFSDPAYFSRFFVKWAGQTPRAWRLAERESLGV